MLTCAAKWSAESIRESGSSCDTRIRAQALITGGRGHAVTTGATGTKDQYGHLNTCATS